MSLEAHSCVHESRCPALLDDKNEAVLILLQLLLSELMQYQPNRDNIFNVTTLQWDIVDQQSDDRFVDLILRYWILKMLLNLSNNLRGRSLQLLFSWESHYFELVYVLQDVKINLG